MHMSLISSWPKLPVTVLRIAIASPIRHSTLWLKVLLTLAGPQFAPGGLKGMQLRTMVCMHATVQDATLKQILAYISRPHYAHCSSAHVHAKQQLPHQ